MAKKKRQRTNKSKSSTRHSPVSLVILGLVIGLTIAIIFYNTVMRKKSTQPSSSQNVVSSASTSPQKTLPSLSSQKTPKTSDTSQEKPSSLPSKAQDKIDDTTKKSSQEQKKIITQADKKPLSDKSSADDQIANLIKQGEKKSKSAKATNEQASKTEKQAEDKIANLIQKHSSQSENTTQSFTPTYLQVGAYKNVQEADSLRAQLLLLGFEKVKIEHTSLNNKPLSRLQIGPFSSQSQLDRARELLNKEKINYRLVPSK